MGHREIYWAVLLLLFGSLSDLKAQQPLAKKRTVIIDAGHGGNDSGAISKNGPMEKDVVLDIAKWIVRWNGELYGGKLEIYLSRDGDSLISLSDRTGLARALRPDLFLSLHCNHSDNGSAKGLEAYVHDRDGKYVGESQRMAAILLSGPDKDLGLVSRGVKRADFQVLRDTRNTCPSILLELGFLSRREESEYLGKSYKRAALALAILESVYKAIQ